MNPITYSPCSSCRKLNRVPTQSGGQPVCGNCKTALPLHGSMNNVSASELMLLAEKSPLPVVVDFWAPWCQPCQVFAPSFEQARISGALPYPQFLAWLREYLPAQAA